MKKPTSKKLVFSKKAKGHKGVHAKNKHSWNKNSKNYVKAYRGQGR
jgi:hypothetical protein